MKRMPTQELSNELKKRKGITSIKIEPYEKIEVGGIVVDGSAVILINQEYLKLLNEEKDDPLRKGMILLFATLITGYTYIPSDVMGLKGRRGWGLS